MAWSDAARQAAALARQRVGKVHGVGSAGHQAKANQLPAKVVHMRGMDTVVKHDSQNFYTRRGRDISKSDVTHIQYQGGQMRPFKGK